MSEYRQQSRADDDLWREWQALIARHTGDPASAGVGSRLLASWGEPARRYHSLCHLRDILARIEELAPLAADADAVRLAAWYHDAVYDGRPDDEERSARRAEAELTALGVAPALAGEVARLVRMTRTHDPAAGDRNGEVLSDADLAPLALPRDHYDRNTAAIRQEYAHVPDEVFSKGRAQVIVTLLGATAVFRTEHGRRLWESAARENLRAELAGLATAEDQS